MTSTENDVRMPPHDTGKMLKPAEIETLRQWIAEGGKYKKHWAFEPPVRPAAPAVKNRGVGSQSDRCVCLGPT